MGGSFQLKAAKESSVITYNTAYAAGTFDVPSLTVTIGTTGGRVFVGLVGSGSSHAYSYANYALGTNPTFTVTSEGAAGGAGTWSIVNTGGTVPAVQPTMTGITDYTLGTTRFSVHGGGGLVGSDSTWYWQYMSGRRVYFGVKTLEEDNAGAWLLSILRTTGATTTAPFELGEYYSYLDTKYLPPGIFSCIDQPARGVHTYKISVQSGVSTGIFGLTNVKLVAYEL